MTGRRGRTTALAVAVLAGLLASGAPAQALTGTSAARTSAPTASATTASAAQVRRVASGWIPYWDLKNAMASVTGHSALFRDVSFYWYAATTSSDVVEQNPGHQPSEARLVAAVQDLQALGVPVYVTVTDHGLDATAMARLLGDRTRRALLVSNLVATAERLGVNGIDIDFESMNFGSVGADRTAVKKLFPDFLGRLQTQLVAAGRTLSVALPPRTGPRDGSWEVFDYRAIAAVVDRARVMAYDYHADGGPIGPVAPLRWVADVARYAGARFGHKASLGLPAYGYNWFVKRLSGSCPTLATTDTTATTRQMEAIAVREGVTPSYVRSVAEYTFTYRRTFSDGSSRCRVERTVWYEDARSVKDKLPLLRRYGLGSVALWRLGGERAGTWHVLGSYATG